MAANESRSLLYLWDKRTLYLGDLLGSVTLNSAASSLVVSLAGDLEISIPGSVPVKTQIVLIPAGATVHVNHYDQPVACCYLDPLNQDFNALNPLLENKLGNVWYDSSEIEKIKSIYLSLYQEEREPAHAYETLMTEIIPENSPVIKSKHYEKIKQVVEFIKQHPIENHSNRYLAEQFGLSDSQLQRQFKAITGIPIRRFRLWHRLFVTATLMGFGMSLTDASIQAGFSDSSHFNHTFRSMLGMKPSFVLKRSEQIKILSGGDAAIDQQLGQEALAS